MVKSHNITISYKELSSAEELGQEDEKLLKEAMDAATNAYAPYSGFRVGAALRLKSGKMVKGANVENAAFPSGICAERTAISSSVSNYPGDKPEAIAIAAFNDDGLTDEPVTPCGNCRQVIAEEEARNNSRIKIILGGRKKIFIIESINSLLPLQFSKSNLCSNLP
jgi:cytidine deaminase